MSQDLIHQLYAGVAPWAALALLLVGRNPHPGIRRKMAALLLPGLLLLAAPVKGWNAAAWIRVLEPNPSITLTALLLVALASRLSGKALFRRGDWSTAWLFGAAASLVLYPMGLGLTRIDPYGWGWGPALPACTALLVTILLLRGNRFGLVLIAVFAGFLLGLPESANFWDALLDPFLAIVSLLITLVTLGGAVVRRVKRSPLTSGEGVID